MKFMYDSVDPFAIPADAAIVAGYGDGRYQWTSEGWARFSGVQLSIVVSALDSGDVLDVEKGDATPAEARDWVLNYKRPVFTVPTIYCNRTAMADVQRALDGLTYDLWIATLDGNTDPLSWPGVGAVQHLGSNLSGGHFDLSVCNDWWPRVTVPQGEDDMFEQKDRDALTRILTMLADGQQATDPGTGQLVPVPAEWPNWLPTQVALLSSKLDALTSRVDSIQGSPGPAGPPGPPGPAGAPGGFAPHKHQTDGGTAV
jgi:hypothetical protein